jgi:hypothetical protein
LCLAIDTDPNYQSFFCYFFQKRTASYTGLPVPGL